MSITSPDLHNLHLSRHVPPFWIPGNNWDDMLQGTPMSIVYSSKHLWRISLCSLTSHTLTTCSLCSRLKSEFQPGRGPGEIFPRAKFPSQRAQKFQHTGWRDGHEMCSQTLWYEALEVDTKYSMVCNTMYVGSAYSVSVRRTDEDPGTFSVQSLFRCGSNRDLQPGGRSCIIKPPPHDTIYRSPSNVVLNYNLLSRYLLDPPMIEPISFDTV